jgi:hypothetical protein
LGKLWGFVKSLFVLAVLAWVAWYGYSQWDSAPSGVGEPNQRGAFNCRQALAKLAEDYNCRNSESCTLSGDDQAEMRKRETDIEQFCN